MSATAFYSPERQFRRALVSDWRLHGLELLYGVLYVVVGFYFSRRLGHSQVYEVVWPLVIAAVLMAYLTWRISSPSVKRTTAPYFFSLPQDRVLALDARLAFLCLMATWFIGFALVCSWLKLGGAGITACYRIHPELVALPFLATTSVFWGLHCSHDKGYWIKVVALLTVMACWFVWKVYAVTTNPSNEGNGYWPERELALRAQLSVASIFMAVAVWLALTARAGWRRRQIGEVQ